MKKTLLALTFILLRVVSLEAQNPELIENIWFAQVTAPFVDDPPAGSIITIPDNFEAIAQFSENMITITHPQCEIGFSAEIEYLDDESFNLLEPFNIDEIVCDNPDFSQFIEAHFNFYFNNELARNIFYYLIIEQTDGTLELVIVNDNASNYSIVYTSPTNLDIEEVFGDDIRLTYNPKTQLISALGEVSEMINLSVYNLSGQKVKEVALIYSEKSISLNNLSKGLYIAQVSNKYGVLKNFKFIKY